MKTLLKLRACLKFVFENCYAAFLCQTRRVLKAIAVNQQRIDSLGNRERHLFSLKMIFPCIIMHKYRIDIGIGIDTIAFIF